MLGIIFFGILSGLATASLLKDFSFSKILGWIIISTIGAVEGGVIATFLQEYTTLQTHIAPLFTVMGSMFLMSLKLLTRPRHQTPRIEAV